MTFVVRSLSRFVQNPGRLRWSQAEHVMRYLKATKNRKLVYENADESRIVGCSDAVWAGTIVSRKSTCDYCFFPNETSGAISWNSELQTTEATSTAEAEAAAVLAATHKLIFPRELCAELGISKSLPSSVFVDSQSCIATTKTLSIP